MRLLCTFVALAVVACQAPARVPVPEPAEVPSASPTEFVPETLGEPELVPVVFSGRGPVDAVYDLGGDSSELLWVHPLAGKRHLPGRDSRRFGARREGRRPYECGAGHCGVDIGSELGSYVHSAARGVVARLDRVGWGRGGRYLVVAHAGETETVYVHLDSLREDLVVGSELAAGEVLGTLGSTGIHHSEPHLHFAVAIYQNGMRQFIDPEPILARAQVLESSDERVSGLRIPGVLRASLPLAPTETHSSAKPEFAVVELVDAGTKRPLAHAKVKVLGSGGEARWVQTDARGAAMVQLPMTGSGTVVVSLAGYVRVKSPLRAGRLVLEIEHSARLAGEIRDRDGQRVGGALVRGGGVEVRSDASGRFALDNVRPGPVLVVAEQGEGRGELELEIAPGDHYVTLQIDLD